MSSRSELLFQAERKISNPFLLCTLVSKRTRQFMMSANRNRSTAELVDYVLGELLDGVLEFEMLGEEIREPKHLRHSQVTAASREVLEVEAR